MLAMLIVLFLLEKSALGGFRTAGRLVTLGPPTYASSEADGTGPPEEWGPAAWGPSSPARAAQVPSVATVHPPDHSFPLHTGQGHAICPIRQRLPRSLASWPVHTGPQVESRAVETTRTALSPTGSPTLPFTPDEVPFIESLPWSPSVFYTRFAQIKIS